MSKSAKRLIFAAILCFFAVFCLLSLVSYNSFDLSDYNGVRNGFRNYGGMIGAYLSHFMYQYFGITSYFILGLCVLWGALLLSEREIKDSWLKVIGVLLFVVTISSLLTRHFIGYEETNAFPSMGGIVGIVFADILVKYLAAPGAFVFLLALMFLSLVFATDMLVVDASKAAYKWFVSVFLKQHVRNIFAAIGRIFKKTPKEQLVPIAPAQTSRKKRKTQDTQNASDSTQVSLVQQDIEEVLQRKKAEEKNFEKKSVEKNQKKPVDEEELFGKKISVAISSSDGEKDSTSYDLPTDELLEEPEAVNIDEQHESIQQRAHTLVNTLNNFGVTSRVVNVETGPVITQYELELAPGIKVGKVLSLNDDISMALKAPVRIVAPIPGKSTVGVEVPNAKKSVVRLKELMLDKQAFKRMEIPLFIGKDVLGLGIINDLTDMPHLLIAGQTGSGKSICLNSIITSLLMTKTPDEVKLLLMDPKMVELSAYKDVPHLICPVVTDMRKAASVLEWACEKMDERYIYLSRANVRHIKRYNKLSKADLIKRMELENPEEIEQIPLRFPYIIIIVDELADLMMVAAKDVEHYVTRLAQKSRAVGIHLVLATQRPSVDVITGLIKSNLPARLSFQVASKVDSRTILDQNGAEKLLGEGDMLYMPPGSAKLIRAQGAYVSEDEVKKVCDYVKKLGEPSYLRELVQIKAKDDVDNTEKDELYDEAVSVILETQRGSVSLLQRRLEIGYSRASRLIDMMAEEGIVGPYKGSQAREVFLTLEEWEERHKAEAKST